MIGSALSNWISRAETIEEPFVDSEAIRVSALCKPYPQFLIGRYAKSVMDNRAKFAMRLGTAWDRVIKNAVESGGDGMLPGGSRVYVGSRMVRAFQTESGHVFNITGEPDLVIEHPDQTATIVDVKLTRGFAAKEVEDGYRWQLSFYAWLLDPEWVGWKGLLLKYLKDFSQTRDPEEFVEMPVELYSAQQVEARLSAYLDRMTADSAVYGLRDDEGPYTLEKLPAHFGCCVEERSRFNGRTKPNPDGSLTTATRCTTYCGIAYACPMAQRGDILTMPGVDL